MTIERKCVGCGANVPPNAPLGHCPKCLLNLAHESAQGEPPVDLGLSAIGRVLGDFELLERIGRGGMGTVYKARQVSLHRLVALKMINAGEFASPMLIQRFHREAEAAANLRHPNIVPIFETGEVQGHHYLSMALIDGISLSEYIRRSAAADGTQRQDARSSTRQRQEEVARIIATVARAVNHAHRHGVLHRDLKPGNILVDKQGQPHLTDFGVAKVIGRGESNLTASGAIMGTPSYMAPEQATGQSKHVTTAADIYSLGAVLYALLTGQPPFQGDTPVETLRQVVEQEPKHPSTLCEGIDCDLATIAMKCLEKEPSRRYATADAMAEDLERWLRREPIVARPTQPTERLWRWCLRNPKLASLAAAVMLLLIAISIGSTYAALHIQRLNDSVQKNNLELKNINHSLSNNVRVVREEVVNDLVKLFSDPNTRSYTISAEKRHIIVGHQPPAYPGAPLVLTFVDYVYGHPTNVLYIFAPILQTLEDKLSHRLHQTVLINLRMMQSYEFGYGDLETNAYTFGRVGPASFSHLLDAGTGFRLLAMQDHKNLLTMALFTHTNSAIARAKAARSGVPLRELVEHCSMAFVTRYSTTGHEVPRWFLAATGIYATNFSACRFYKNHQAVIESVQKRESDLGASNLELVKKNGDLEIIAQYPISDLGRCWVAGKGISSELFQDLQKILLAMKDPAIIGRIESEIVGFKVVGNDSLDRLRLIMRGADAFETGEATEWLPPAKPESPSP